MPRFWFTPRSRTCGRQWGWTGGDGRTDTPPTAQPKPSTDAWKHYTETPSDSETGPLPTTLPPALRQPVPADHCTLIPEEPAKRGPLQRTPGLQRRCKRSDWERETSLTAPRIRWASCLAQSHARVVLQQGLIPMAARGAA